MGIYVENVLACQLKKASLSVILEELEIWTGRKEYIKLETAPRHYGILSQADLIEFPGPYNFSLVDCIDGGYVETPNEFWDTKCFSIRATRKSTYYDMLIEFMIWIAQYSNTEGFVGYVRSELEENPRLIFFLEGKAYLREIGSYDEKAVLPY